jgi:hypothetical protein
MPGVARYPCAVCALDSSPPTRLQSGRALVGLTRTLTASYPGEARREKCTAAGAIGK